MVYYTVSGYNDDMFLVGILSWWYGSGWAGRLLVIKTRLMQTSDYFSIGILLGTLFAPYRQISAGGVRGSMAAQLRAFGDRLISRIIGAFLRTGLIIFGIVALCVQVIWGAIVMAVWPFVPLFPLCGVILWSIGWVPSWV